MADVKTNQSKASAYAGTEGDYHLPHHAKEIERLQRQHNFILSSTNNTLLTAPLDGKKTVRILDSGAADGTWLRDVARLNPQHEWDLHGVDIGSALFPPKTGPNAALNLAEFDIRQEVPASLGWHESFDVVHQRLLIWGLKGAEWQHVIKQQRELLKPGGWIEMVEGQWVDRDHPFDAAKYPSLAKMSQMQKWTTAAFGMNIFVAYELEGMLKECGFTNVKKTSFDLGYGAKAKDPAWKEVSTEMWIETFRSIGLKLPAGGIPGVAKDADEFWDFLDKLKAEVLEYGYSPKLNFVIGQKPA